MHDVAPKITAQFGSRAHSVAFLLIGCAALTALSTRLARAVRGSRKVDPPVSGAQINFLLKGRDPLTKLDDLNGLQTTIGNGFASQAPSALILLRLDSLHEIIASHGHSAGETVLIDVADRLRALWPTGRWSRLIGDDFGFVLGGRQTQAQLEEAALSIIRSVELPIQTLHGQLLCTASLGITRLSWRSTWSGSDVMEALSAAFSALGVASAAGGSQWSIYDPKRHELNAIRNSIKEELRTAVEVGQIIPYYQPVIDLRNGQVVGLEILARWEHPTRGVLMPDVFIPMAEEMHLAGKISQVLMRRVVADARHWPTYLYFAFNASPGQLREIIDLVTSGRLWPEGSLDPTRLELEITESALIEDLEVARTVIELLQVAGARVVLDDFGVGHSNFFHLRELPFDKIKIDKSFVLDLGRDPRADACVRTMIALGKSLGIDMVAEGLESAETAAYLAELGCLYGQGYLYSVPVSADAVSKLLRKPSWPSKSLVEIS